jgi:hypothetical protein
MRRRDFIAVYRVWLRYELFRGRLSEREHQESEGCLTDFIGARWERKGSFAETG